MLESSAKSQKRRSAWTPLAETRLAFSCSNLWAEVDWGTPPKLKRERWMSILRFSVKPAAKETPTKGDTQDKYFVIVVSYKHD